MSKLSHSHNQEGYFMSELERERKAEIEAIELTEEEMKSAIQEAKIKKWFHLHRLEYWTKQEIKDVRNLSRV